MSLKTVANLKSLLLSLLSFKPLKHRRVVCERSSYRGIAGECREGTDASSFFLLSISTNARWMWRNGNIAIILITVLRCLR